MAELTPVMDGALVESVIAPASAVQGRRSIASLRPATDRASRGLLNGCLGALAGVRRHRIGGSRQRVLEAALTGLSDARFVFQPAYSLGPHSVSPLRRLAGGCAPSDPRTGNGAP